MILFLAYFQPLVYYFACRAMKGINQHNKQIKLIGIPLFLLAHWIGNQYYLQPLSWHVVKQNSLVLVLVVIQWEFITRVIFFFRRKFPSSHHLFFRLLFTLLTCGLGGMILATLIFEAPDWYVGKLHLSIALFGANFGPMFILSALVMGVYEVVYNFYQLRKIEQEKELLQKAHLQSQLDSLKSQVNPHFLFNSLLQPNNL
jgi:hypothetical protein